MNLLNLRRAAPPGRAGALSDQIELRRAIMLCSPCASWRMGRKWRSKYGYHAMAGYKAHDTCDLCKQFTVCALYIREEGRLAEEARDVVDLKKRYQAKGPDSGIIII